MSYTVKTGTTLKNPFSESGESRRRSYYMPDSLHERIEIYADMYGFDNTSEAARDLIRIGLEEVNDR